MRRVSGFLRVIPLGITLLSVNGCATLFKGGIADVDIDSDPTGAELTIDGENYGETPTTVDLNSNEDHVFEFRKDGYEPATYVLTNHLGAGWVVLDVLLFWPSAIVDGSTGNWYAFDEYDVHVELAEKSENVPKEPEASAWSKP
jgi:hypothetical protein